MCQPVLSHGTEPSQGALEGRGWAPEGLVRAGGARAACLFSVFILTHSREDEGLL